ncbi:MAG: hypothetical protein E7004_06550 [Alphaproteobacteria bacterium]|nr:hypothetical protein [Alphaproteobacteria bacterium]
MDKLFDLRLDGELDRETFYAKRNDIQLQMNRFSEFVDNNILSEQVAKLHEPMQKQAEQGLQAKNNEYLQIGCLKSIEPTQSLKNQGLAKNFANPLQIGALGRKGFADLVRSKI